MKHRIFLGALALLAAMLCGGCGHHHNNSTTTGLVRLVNATGASGLSLAVTNSAADSTAVTAASGVGAGAASSYTAVATGTSSVVVSGGSLTTSSTSTISIAQDNYYTIIAYERNGAINFLTFGDGTSSQTTPATGYAFLALSNPAPDAGPLDVYVVAPGTVVDDTVTPKYVNVSSGGSSQSQSIAAGTYDIIVTAYNKPADVRFKWSNFSLVDQEQGVLMLTNTDGGALVNGVLVQRNVSSNTGGPVTVTPNTNARIRLVGAFSGLYRLDYNNGLTGNALVSDSVITSGIGANAYKTVPSGTTVQNVSVTASGSSAVAATLSDALKSAALAAGNEYTLLVYGDITAPSVQLLVDNNQAPTAARIRMINVVSWPGNDAFNVISLYNSSVQLFPQPIGYGQASAYAGLSTGISHLNAQVEALSNPLVTIQDGKNIALGGVYTLVMGGTNTSYHSTANPPVPDPDALILDRCLPNFTC